MTDLIVVQRSPTIVVANGPAVPVPHGPSHGPAGADPLSAYYAALAHASQHAPGGTDELLALTMGRFLTNKRPIWERDKNTGNSTSSTGQVCLGFFTARDDFTFTKLGTGVGTAGSAVTLCRLGLYTVAGNGDVTLVARTANDTTIATTGSSANARVIDTAGGFPASYALVKGVEYAWGLICVATTTGSWVARAFGGSAQSLLPPRMAGSLAGQSDLPLSIANGSIGGISVPPWGYVEA